MSNANDRKVSNVEKLAAAGAKAAGEKCCAAIVVTGSGRTYALSLVKRLPWRYRRAFLAAVSAFNSNLRMNLEAEQLLAYSKKRKARPVPKVSDEARAFLDAERERVNTPRSR